MNSYGEHCLKYFPGYNGECKSILRLLIVLPMTFTLSLGSSISLRLGIRIVFFPGEPFFLSSSL